MKKIYLIPLLIFTLFPCNPSKAYDSQAQADAAIMVIAACTWYQLGQIPRSQIMNFAKEQYRAKHGNPAKVNWSGAISIADKIDKKEKLGCLN